MIPPPLLQNHRVKVLLIEDAPVMQKFLTLQLEAIPGVKIVGVAETAPAGVNEFDLRRPDMVVLDLTLREGNGFEVMRAIKQRQPTCRVVVFTSHDADLFRTRCADEGADAFFSKATQFSQLLQTVRSLAEGRPTEQAPGLNELLS